MSGANYWISDFVYSPLPSIPMVCLYGEILGRMENWGEKSGEKAFLVGFWLGEETKVVGPSVFSSSSPKSFLSKLMMCFGHNCPSQTLLF